jgi:hypothetical protein
MVKPTTSFRIVFYAFSVLTLTLLLCFTILTVLHALGLVGEGDAAAGEVLVIDSLLFLLLLLLL